MLRAPCGLRAGFRAGFSRVPPMQASGPVTQASLTTGGARRKCRSCADRRRGV